MTHRQSILRREDARREDVRREDQGGKGRKGELERGQGERAKAALSLFAKISDETSANLFMRLFKRSSTAAVTSAQLSSRVCDESASRSVPEPRLER